VVRAVVQVLTFVARGSGFVGRKLARVAGRGKPVSSDLKPYIKVMHRWSYPIMLLGWNVPRVRPDHAQLKV